MSVKYNGGQAECKKKATFFNRSVAFLIAVYDQILFSESGLDLNFRIWK